MADVITIENQTQPISESETSLQKTFVNPEISGVRDFIVEQPDEVRRYVSVAPELLESILREGNPIQTLVDRLEAESPGSYLEILPTFQNGLYIYEIPPNVVGLASEVVENKGTGPAPNMHKILTEITGNNKFAFQLARSFVGTITHVDAPLVYTILTNGS